MTSIRSSSTNTKTRSATRRIESFRQRFGDGHFYLACHAALPLALTPDLLYSLWANFQRDAHGEAIEIPWIAVADLMLSNLCKEVGNELYEIDMVIRGDLLNQLQQDPRFGMERIQELANFVIAYVEHQLDSPDLDTRDLAEAQNWRALAYKHPSAAAQSIALALTKLSLEDKAEWIRMASLLETSEEPLFEFQQLLSYAHAMADFARGKLAAAQARFSEAVNADNQIVVAGINLPIPALIQADLLNQRMSGFQQRIPPISILNRYRWLISVGTSSIISLVLIVGLIVTLRSGQSTRPDPTKPTSTTPSSSPLNPQTPSPSALPSTHSTTQSSSPQTVPKTISKPSPSGNAPNNQTSPAVTAATSSSAIDATGNPQQPKTEILLNPASSLSSKPTGIASVSNNSNAKKDNLTNIIGVNIFDSKNSPWASNNLPFNQAVLLEESGRENGRAVIERFGIDFRDKIDPLNTLAGVLQNPFSAPAPGRFISIAAWSSRTDGCSIELLTQFSPPGNTKEFNISYLVPTKVQVDLGGEVITLQPKEGAEVKFSDPIPYEYYDVSAERFLSSSWYQAQSQFAISSKDAKKLLDLPSGNTKFIMSFNNDLYRNVVFPLGESTSKSLRDVFSFNPDCVWNSPSKPLPPFSQK